MIRLIVCLSLVSAIAPTTSHAQDYKSPLTKLDLKDGDTIVFLGDSITHQCLYTQYVENYFYTRYPKLKIKTHNAGVGGATAWDALARFDKDVAAYKPKYVTVLLGMNDGRYRPFDKEIFATYQKDMKEVIARIKKAGATPILMTPTMYDSRAARMRKRRRKTPEATLNQYNAVLAYYGAWLREVAVNEGYGFVDMYQRLNALTLSARKKDPKYTVIKDSVHPDAPGQAVMAYSILSDLVPRTAVSSIMIGRSGKGFIARSKGGKLTNLKRRPDGGVQFNFKANHLPWVLPDEAQSTVQLLRMRNLRNAELLRFIGLPRGKWELRIDGELVGVFTHTSFFNGLQMHNAKKSPQYKQALAIANLNKKRNDGPIRSLRNEWRTFQQYARLKRQLKDNAKLKERVEALAKKLEGLDERVKKHQADAKKIEDEIYKINQPKDRKYVIQKPTLTGINEVVTRGR